MPPARYSHVDFIVSAGRFAGLIGRQCLSAPAAAGATSAGYDSDSHRYVTSSYRHRRHDAISMASLSYVLCRWAFDRRRLVLRADV